MSRKEKLLYPFYVISHPFDGFYEIRHREKGSVPIALLLVFLFGLSWAINFKYAGFVVNFNETRGFNAINQIVTVFLGVILISVANWSITCLMEGEGRFKDIITVIGYSMLPLVLTWIPATIISWFVAADEESLYSMLLSLSVIYFVLLLLIGIMTIHNFSFGKTIITIVLTFVALLLIIFVISLVSSLVDQVRQFFISMYTELVLRV